MSDGEASDGSDEPLERTPAVPVSMRTEMWPIGRVQRYTGNPRKDKNIAKMVAMLNEYGWRQPITVDKDGVIVTGDTRYLGGQARGDSHVPVWVARDLTEQQIHAYRIADNRMAEESDWDRGALAAELALLESMGVDTRDELQTLTGFDETELDRYLKDATEATRTLDVVDVQPFPVTTWVLIAIPTVRYVEIAEHIERIAGVPEIFCEVTANDEAHQ